MEGLTVLDEQAIIAERDKSDALGVAANELEQLKYEFPLEFLPKGEIRNVVLAGMGGSALWGEYLAAWPGLSVPFTIVRDYTIPQFVDEHTLFVSSSFSGNTEETLEALDQAEAAGAQIVVIAAGGKLEQRAQDAGHPFMKLDNTIPQPRMATFNNLKAMMVLWEAAGLVEGKVDELMAAGEKLANTTSAWAADVPTADNQAKQIAQELMGKSPVIYGGGLMYPLANKWKISFNENAKNVAWRYALPEFNHNEFIGWSSHPIEKPYAVINLRSELEHERTQKRFDVSDRLLSGRRPSPVDVQVQGETIIEQLLWGTMLGDFVSIYLALLNNVDPTPVDLVEDFKAELNK